MQKETKKVKTYEAPKVKDLEWGASLGCGCGCGCSGGGGGGGGGGNAQLA